MKAGEQLGTYVVDEVIGRGSTGVVWLGHRLDGGSRVAIKVLKSAFDDDAVQRGAFLREGRLLVEHPIAGAVTVLQTVDDEVGAAMVMEFVPGRTLRAMLEADGALPPDKAAAIVESVADTLSKAHAAGIVHGDVKPENIVMRDELTPVLMDFGLARVLEEASLSSSRSMTQLAGTPHYVAPEIYSGGRGERPADVYALGVVLYECVTGRRPFTASSTAGLATQHREAPPAPTAAFPEALWSLTEEMLAKKPPARPTATQVAAQLRNAASRGLLKAGDLATTTWTRDRASSLDQGKPVVDRKRRSLVAVAAAFALVAGAGLSMWLAQDHSQVTPMDPTADSPPQSPERSPAATSKAGTASGDIPGDKSGPREAPQEREPVPQPQAPEPQVPQPRAPEPQPRAPESQTTPPQPPRNPGGDTNPKTPVSTPHFMEKECTSGKASLWVRWEYATSATTHYWNEIYYRVNTGTSRKTDIRVSIWIDGKFVPNTREGTSLNDNGVKMRFRYYRQTPRTPALEEMRVEAFHTGTGSNPYCALSVKL